MPVQCESVPRHLPGLDFLRAAGVLLVVWFHNWQQTWLTPQNAAVARWVRYGAVFVDLLILLSAVCNFWPYARAIALGEPWPDTGTFYRRRAARILPSYLLSVVVCFCIALAQEHYASVGAALGDLVSYLTFTMAWRPHWIIWTGINYALWTVQVEMFYYLLMPFLARAFRRRPVLTCAALFAVFLAVWAAVIFAAPQQIRVLLNQTLSFAGYYAAGMLLCMGYLRMRLWLARHPQRGGLLWLSLPAAVLALLAFDRILCCFDVGDRQYMQMLYRPLYLPVLALLAAAMLCLPAVPARLVQCAPVRFVCAISYNLYIWHQWLSVLIKTARIPYWEGDTPPNQLYDTAWSRRYDAIIVTAALLTAIVLTYGWERPLHRRLLGRKKA